MILNQILMNRHDDKHALDNHRLLKRFLGSIFVCIAYVIQDNVPLCSSAPYSSAEQSYHNYSELIVWVCDIYHVRFKPLTHISEWIHTSGIDRKLPGVKWGNFECTILYVHILSESSGCHL